ncbi:MAG: class I SAM-dependent methyltransferase [Oscillospiraceae bacterium]|nr:class I SAM-dependent methyltransferase [Oscillospiraceae bacterium]
MKLKNIDGEKAFDWGKTSENYAKFRDIYPDEFYRKIIDLGHCKDGQIILDIGTGTGVLPRNMYKFGGKWIGTDISENQIEQAKILSKNQNMDIEYYVCPAEEIDYPDDTFDVVTACQCIWYPDHNILAPKLSKILKNGGKFLILYMAWLPFEDEIAGKSEEIILKYNPKWSGAKETRKPMWVPDEYLEYFDVTHREEFDINVPFTRESWHGRMLACRGVGASLSDDEISLWEKEHKEMLNKNAPEEFEVLHYVAIAELTVKK